MSKCQKRKNCITLLWDMARTPVGETSIYLLNLNLSSEYNSLDNTPEY